jgi:hypothetical protein
MHTLRANVHQAVEYLGALDIRVRAKDVVFNEDGEITFVCLELAEQIVRRLETMASHHRDNTGYVFKTADGELHVDPLGLAGCTISLRTIDS